MHWNPAVGVPMFIVGLIVLASIWLFGQPRKPGQGRRQPKAAGDQDRGVRREPTLGQAEGGIDGAAETSQQDAPARDPVQASLLDSPASDPAPPAPPATAAPGAAAAPAKAPSRAPAAPVNSGLGRRPGGQPMERIVTLNVVASETDVFQGSDLVVAADKAGLEFGHKGIFHRLIEGKPELGPVFSVANMLQPGSFDLAQVSALTTTGLSFFMTLPGPIPALDAWDAMLPTAQRMAELLGGQILDNEHNALGRQRIAHIRDELRAWDRKHTADFGS